MLTFQNRFRKTLALEFVTEKHKLKWTYILAYIKNFEARELANIQEVLHIHLPDQNSIDL